MDYEYHYDPKTIHDTDDDDENVSDHAVDVPILASDIVTMIVDLQPI